MFRKRAGVTLIELLVVILIISILAALVLGVAAVAGETARKSRTTHTVERLHTLLMEYMGQFKHRRVALRASTGNKRDGVVDQITDKGPTGPARNLAIAEARLYAMREMILAEVPDSWSDIALAPVGQPIGQPVYLDQRTPLANVYLRKYQGLVKSGVDPEMLRNNQGAECLYLVIMNACGDGEARRLFSDSEIGDSDGDGAKEFLDGWGHPINFLRWAPGFDSQIQANASRLATALEWQIAADKDHDPYDLYKADTKAFRLVPLIYSPGRDESSGLYSKELFNAWVPTDADRTLKFTSNTPYIDSPRLLPWDKIPSGVYLGGSTGDGTSTDNIHNHLLGLRN